MMKKYYNLLHIALRENKKNRQSRLLAVLLFGILFMIQTAVLAHVTIAALSADGIDMISQTALNGADLMTGCMLIIFLLCFAIINLMKTLDMHMQIQLLKVLGYQNRHMMCFVATGWLVMMLTAMLIGNILMIPIGLLLLDKIGIATFSVQMPIIVQAIGYSNCFLLLYASILLGLQCLLISI